MVKLVCIRRLLRAVFPNKPYDNKQSASVNDRYQVLHRYDGLGRLLQADYCHFALITSSACTSVNHYDLTGMTYDRQGNLLTLNRRDATGTRVDSLLYGYQAGRNRLSSLRERAGASSATWDAEAGSFTCDKSGNVMTMPAPWSVSASVYDARNLPVSVTASGVTTTYRYNAQGQRSWKRTGSSSGAFYVLDGSVVLGLFSETGTRTYWNYVAGGEVFARVSGGIRKYYSKDHLGSVRAVQEETGVVIEAEDYDAWGVAMTGRSYLSGVGAKEGYTGKERDAETGLDYFGARYYLGAIGRWGGVDALSDRYPGWSPYTYVLNSPLRLVDPNGQEIQVCSTTSYTDANGEEQQDQECTSYTADMEYEGNDQFIQAIVAQLNQLGSLDEGAFILKQLIDSDNIFSIVNQFSSLTGGDVQGASFIKNKTGGGTIRAGGLLGMSEANAFETLAHETFHAFQYENGQPLYSVNAEVEAYLFGALARWYQFYGLASMAREDGSVAAAAYSKATLDLLFGELFSQQSYIAAIINFKQGSLANSPRQNYPNGAYANFPVLQVASNPLISRFLPLH